MSDKRNLQVFDPHIFFNFPCSLLYGMILHIANDMIYLITMHPSRHTFFLLDNFSRSLTTSLAKVLWHSLHHAKSNYSGTTCIELHYIFSYNKLTFHVSTFHFFHLLTKSLKKRDFYFFYIFHNPFCNLSKSSVSVFSSV